MDANLLFVALSCLCLSMCVVTSSQATQTCKSHRFSGGQNYESCVDLARLGSFLHWNFTRTTGEVTMAFRRPKTNSDSWIAWAINPTGKGMEGSQALVAHTSGNKGPTAYTSSVTSYSTTLPPSNLSFKVRNLSATYEKMEMTIFGSLLLGGKIDPSKALIVWQFGPMIDNRPAAHSFDPANKASITTLSFSSSQTAASGVIVPRLHRKNIHGILNALSWGILMPIGAIFARYLKVFKSADPAWFYLHVTCQASAYIIGVAGWATGIQLGKDSAGITYSSHRNIGITLFVFGTLQVFALLLRPNKDHKFRLYWNIYHRGIGYAVIVLSIVNIFKGFDILEPAKKWKHAYIGILISLGTVAVILEAATWAVVVKRKPRSDKNLGVQMNGANGRNPQAA